MNIMFHTLASLAAKNLGFPMASRHQSRDDAAKPGFGRVEHWELVN